MDLQPQVSFIPKKPLTASTASSVGTPSILWIVAIFIFIASVFAAVGVFGYAFFLQKRIADAKEDLEIARKAFDPTSIQDLIRLNARLNQGGKLLASHIAPSAIFDFLEANTLTTVRFTSFQYATNPDGSISLSLSGNALNFSSVALQSDQFGAAVGTLKNVIFSNVNIDPVTGIVGFGVSANINPAVLDYTAQAAGVSALPPSPDPSNAPASQEPAAAQAAGSDAPAPIPPQ